MNACKHPLKFRHGGFTILELAVVLGVIALIAGAGLNMATGALKAADRVTTQERLNTIKLALDSFAKTYGYLPCPANRVIVPTNATFGIESRSGTVCTAIATGVVASSSVWIGALPVRTLGLPDNYAGDAWGNKFTYATSVALVAGPTSYLNAAGGSVAVRYGTLGSSILLGNARNVVIGGTATSTTQITFGGAPGITPSDRAYLSSPNCKGSFMPASVSGASVTFASPVCTALDSGISMAWLTPGAGMAYAVVSHGPDGRGAFPLNGTTIPTAKTCNAAASDGTNCDDNTSFLEGFFNDGSQVPLYYDDYIVYGSHEPARGIFNPSLYTSVASNCPTGTCEAWCAGCSVNYPGAVPQIPPTSIASTSSAILCRKIITSNATQCTASCFWAGNTASGYVKCP